MEPPGPAFGRPDDKLRDIRDGLTRISLRSIRATRPTNFKAMFKAGSSEHDRKLAAVDFTIFHDLIRDCANHVYRDGKSHARIGVARAEEGRIDADEFAAQVDQSSA